MTAESTVAEIEAAGGSALGITADRAELVALRRLGTVKDCAKVVEFLATDLSDYVHRAVIGWM